MEQEQGRSEAPTAFKLMQARRKGQVARGMDLSFLSTSVAFLMFCWVGGDRLIAALSRVMHDTLASASLVADEPDSILSVLAQASARAMAPLMLLLGGVFALVLLLELLQTGVVFSSEPLKADFSRLNPAQGLKRLFTLRMLLETGKNVLKLALYSAVTWLLIRSALRTELSSVHDAPGLVRVGARMLPRLLAIFAGVALAVAILDQLITRRSFFQRMRMSRRELKQEARDREGEPRLKQKRKQMHAEFVRNSRSMKGVRGADMLLVNPMHVAVALRYDPAGMASPRVTATGVNQLALRLKRLAFVYGVPVIEDPPLARALQRSTPIDQPIPSSAFRAVAGHYNRLRRQRAGKGE